MRYIFLLFILSSCAKPLYKIQYKESGYSVYRDSIPVLREDMSISIWKSYRYKQLIDYKE